LLGLRETGGTCRLSLAGRVYGDGRTLQEAADDLVSRVLTIALCLRTGCMSVSGEIGSEAPWFEFLWEIGETAASGGDIRGRILGPPDPTA